ncbi:hypothetical protein ACU63S_21625 [Klebsiella aerogenes]
MAFYNVPYKELLSSRISPTAKLLYLQLESWYSYCKKKNKPCTVYLSQLCQDLNLDINDIVNAARQLNENKLTITHPEKNAVLVSWMKTIDKEYY